MLHLLYCFCLKTGSKYSKLELRKHYSIEMGDYDGSKESYRTSEK